MLKNIEYFLATQLETFAGRKEESGINVTPITEWVLGKFVPIFGLFGFAVVLGIVIYIGGFWLSYAVADEEGKEEKIGKWKKTWKGLIIAAIVCTSLGTIAMTIGLVFGIEIDL